MQRDIRRLLAIVFLCGASLMALQMAGVRVLNVYFGTTHYVWGGIIGLFLGALALGYFLGGIVADRSPRYTTLGALIAASGLFHFLIPVIARPLCEALAASGLDTRWQALLGSVALYGIPSVLLGMVSPFAVRLAAQSVEDMGRVAGRLYAVSTAGSLVGTFAVSFVLIEYFGNFALIAGIGLTLLVSAALAFGSAFRAVPTVGVGMILACGIWFGMDLGMTVPAHFRNHVVLEEFDSPYHHVIVLESDNYTRPFANAKGTVTRARYLLFNNLTQSGIAIGTPETEARITPAAEYVTRLNLGQIFQDTPPESLCIIGGGGGVGPMMFRQAYPELRTIDVVDIDPAVFRVARQYFRYDDTDGVIRSHTADGRLFLRNTDMRYDSIVLDAYSAGGRIPWHLVTREYLETVKSRLTPRGVVLMNIISAREGRHARLLQSVWKTAGEVFPSVYLFPRHGSGQGAETADNMFLVCTLEAETRSPAEVLALYRKRLDGSVRLQGLLDTVLACTAYGPVPEGTPLLTDDFAPTDGMTFR